MVPGLQLFGVLLFFILFPALILGQKLPFVFLQKSLLFWSSSLDEDLEPNDNNDGSEGLTGPVSHVRIDVNEVIEDDPSALYKSDYMAKSEMEGLDDKYIR